MGKPGPLEKKHHNLTLTILPAPPEGAGSDLRQSGLSQARRLGADATTADLPAEPSRTVFTSSLMTRRWRRESGANPSLKWGFRRLGTTVIPKPLWTIIEAEKGYFGLENGGVSVFAPWQLPRYLDP
jgi:hypothetical protein